MRLLIVLFLILNISPVFAETTWSKKKDTEWEIIENKDGKKRSVDIEWFESEIKAQTNQIAYYNRLISEVQEKISIYQTQKSRFTSEGLKTYEDYTAQKWAAEQENSVK